MLSHFCDLLFQWQFGFEILQCYHGLLCSPGATGASAPSQLMLPAETKCTSLCLGAARWGIGGASPMVQWPLSWVSPPACLVLMRFALDLCWCQLLGQKVLTWVSFFWRWECQKMLVLGHILFLGGWQGDVNLLSPSDTTCKDGKHWTSAVSSASGAGLPTPTLAGIWGMEFLSGKFLLCWCRWSGLLEVAGQRTGSGTEKWVYVIFSETRCLRFVYIFIYHKTNNALSQFLL